MWSRRPFLGTASALPFVGGLIAAHGAVAAVAAMVTSGVASALTLGTAAVLTGLDLQKMAIKGA